MQADGDGDASFEISEEAPASQTSIVVDDAWPSEKEKNRRAVMKAPCGPRKSERKVQRLVFFRLRSLSFVSSTSFSLSFSLSHPLSQPKKTKTRAAKHRARLGRDRCREGGDRERQAVPGAAEEEEEGRSSGSRSRGLIFFHLVLFVFLWVHRNYSHSLALGNKNRTKCKE